LSHNEAKEGRAPEVTKGKEKENIEMSDVTYVTPRAFLFSFYFGVSPPQSVMV